MARASSAFWDSLSCLPQSPLLRALTPPSVWAGYRQSEECSPTNQQMLLGTVLLLEASCICIQPTPKVWAQPALLSEFIAPLFSVLWVKNPNPNQPCLGLSLVLAPRLFIHDQNLPSISHPHLNIFYFLKTPAIGVCPPNGQLLLPTPLRPRLALLSFLRQCRINCSLSPSGFPKPQLHLFPLSTCLCLLYLSSELRIDPTASWMSPLLQLIVSANSTHLR